MNITFDPTSGNQNFWTNDNYLNIDDGTRYPLSTPDDGSFVFCSGTANDINTTWNFGSTEQDYYVQSITLWQRKNSGFDVPSGIITIGGNTFSRSVFNTTLGPPWYYAIFDPEDFYPSGFISSGTSVNGTLITPELGINDVASVDSLYINFAVIGTGELVTDPPQVLFLQGAITHSGTLNSYIEGSPLSTKRTDLYTQGPFTDVFLDSGNIIGPTGGLGPSFHTINYVEQSGGINLFMKLDGSGEYLSADLSIGSSSGVSSNIPLFIGSSSHSGSLNLILQGPTPAESKRIDNITLFAGAATGDFLFNIASMISYSGELFIQGPGDEGTSTINTEMFTQGGFGQVGQGVNVNLFVQNNDELFVSGVDLFIEGSPIRTSGNMNLFMNRENNSTANRFNLYLDSRDPNSTGNVSLYTFGVSGVVDSGISLYIGGLQLDNIGTTKLYSHGH